MDSRKPLTAVEIEELKEEIRTMPHKEFFGENLQPLIDYHSRMSALLTPPPDAAVRDAVDVWADAEHCSPIRSRWTRFRAAALILRRAVQAPRLGLSALLPDDFSDSKDWRDGDPAERIEWLKSMLTAMREREAEAWKQGELSPRLTGEQVEAAFREGYELGNDDGRNIDVFCHIKQHNPESNPDFAWEHSNTRRAAFPEAFAGEVGRGK